MCLLPALALPRDFWTASKVLTRQAMQIVSTILSMMSMAPLLTLTTFGDAILFVTHYPRSHGK